MGITIKDVAAVAGVSPATVSRFLTGNAKVAEETAQQIRKVIEELGYQPDRVARALRQRKTQLLGYIVPNLNNLIAMQLLIALEREASERGFLIAVSSAGNLANTEVVQIERLVAQGIDGLFIFPSGGEQTCDALTRVLGDEIPVVQIGQLVNGVAADYVGVDYMAGMDALARHLMREGLHKLAFIGEGANSYIGEAQIKAITEITRRYPELSLSGIQVGGHSAEFGRQSTNLLLSQPDPPEAIICGSDTIASGSQQALQFQENGGQPVSIVAFGGVHPLIQAPASITVVSFPYADIAQESMRIMLQRISGLATDPLMVGITPNLRIAPSVK